MRARVSSPGLLGFVLSLGCRLIRPEPPSTTAPVVPDVPESRVDLSFSAPVAPVWEYVESIVPRDTGAAPYNVNVNGGADNCGKGVSLGYGISRGPLRFGASGNQFSMGADVSYWLKGRARKTFLCVLIYGSCGVDEAPRTAQVGLATTLTLTNDWKIDADTRAAPVHPTNRCEVTILNIDVTDSAVGAMQRVLGDQAQKIDERLEGAVPVQAMAADGWRTLQEPIEVAAGMWLQVSPEAAKTSQMQAQGDAVRLGLGLTARPKITIGPRPDPTNVPLPPLETGSIGTSFDVHMPVAIDFASATKQVRAALGLDKGPQFYPPVGKPSARVDDVEVFAIGAEMIVKVRLGGRYRGWVYLVGKPLYDAATQTLSFPSLDYDVKTKNLLLKVADWVLHSQIREDLRNRAVFSIAAELGAGKEALTQAMNKKVGAVRLSGNISTLDLSWVVADPKRRRFLAHFLASGTLQANLDPDPSMQK